MKKKQNKVNESLGDKMYDPRKVKIVVKYLDNGFKRGSMYCVGSDGYPSAVNIAAMLGGDGSVLKNMTMSQLFYLLQDRFLHILSDSDKRDIFLKDIIDGWFSRSIGKNGIIKIKARKK